MINTPKSDTSVWGNALDRLFKNAFNTPETWLAWEIISRRRAVSLAASVSREMDLSLDTDDDDDDDDVVCTIAIGVVCVVEVHFSILWQQQPT